MMILTTKISKKKIVIGFLILFAVIGGAVMLSEESDANAAQTIEISNDKIETEEDRLNFVTSLGYGTEGTPTKIMEVIIPEEFDSVYERYNDLQIECGYDLAEYKGERVKLFQYKITGHESGKENVFMNLLIFEETIIGGDITDDMTDGFMTGLKPLG